jgi:hypothetical protein
VVLTGLPDVVLAVAVDVAIVPPLLLLAPIVMVIGD